jgi:hypothetical protein
MPLTAPLLVRLLVVSLLAGVSACGSDLVLPDPPDGGQNVALTKYAGDAQTGVVGEMLEAPLVVQVLTQHEQPVSSRKVVFETSDAGAGQVSPDTAITNEEGQATARWVLGTAAGPHLAAAHLVGGEAENQSAEFTAAAKAAAPDTLRPTSPLAQPGRRKEPVPNAPTVHVVDKYGNPVGSTPVAWQVTAGDGQVREAITATDAEGNAMAQWTLGDRIGFQKLTATIGQVTGSPVTFTVTVFP